MARYDSSTLGVARSVPTSGTVIDYTNRRVLHTIRWARANFDVDTSRVYAFGYSLGGTLALRLALAHPELGEEVGAVRLGEEAALVAVHGRLQHQESRERRLAGPHGRTTPIEEESPTTNR